jgi:bacterioferritin-associated ferredoxin
LEEERQSLKTTLIFNFADLRMADVHARERRLAMIVCHCRNVTDRQIKRLVREGACSAREVARSTGAGMHCGGCRSAVKEVVDEAVESELRPSGATRFLDMAVPVEG